MPKSILFSTTVPSEFSIKTFILLIHYTYKYSFDMLILRRWDTTAKFGQTISRGNMWLIIQIFSWIKRHH